MRHFRLSLLVVSTFFLFPGDAQPQSAKYGVVNVQRILQTSKGGRDARASLDREKMKLESTIQKRREGLTRLADKVRDLQVEIDQKSAVWRQEERERKAFELRAQRRELAREEDGLRRLLRESRRDLEDRQRIAVAKVLKEVRSIVQEIGKEEGWDIIIDNTSGGVLFVSPKVDLTGKVIERYDKKKK